MRIAHGAGASECGLYKRRHIDPSLPRHGLAVPKYQARAGRLRVQLELAASAAC